MNQCCCLVVEFCITKVRKAFRLTKGGCLRQREVQPFIHAQWHLCVIMQNIHNNQQCLVFLFQVFVKKALNAIIFLHLGCLEDAPSHPRKGWLPPLHRTLTRPLLSEMVRTLKAQFRPAERSQLRWFDHLIGRSLECPTLILLYVSNVVSRINILVEWTVVKQRCLKLAIF